MHNVNLLSIVDVSDTLDEAKFKMYMQYMGTSIKPHEINDIKCLLGELNREDYAFRILDGYYLSYSISQIGKEFDMLRFGEEYIVNLEIKQESSQEKVRDQLIRNKYYLEFLNKPLFCISFISKSKELFQLDENDMLISIEISDLISILEEQELVHIDDIDRLFNPSNYLISPLNSPKEFIDGKYFLTSHQEEIKNEIVSLSKSNRSLFMAITGSAGTGKTLLSYDIARQMRKMHKTVLVVHGGALNYGQRYLIEEYGWDIIPIKLIDGYLLRQYEFFLIDEAQRIQIDQLNKIFTHVRNNGSNCLFSYDSEQCLAQREISRDAPNYIKRNTNPRTFSLTEKIRTNKEIANFIKSLFNKKNNYPSQIYSNVTIQYFTESESAKEYVLTLINRGWKSINYTPSSYDTYPYDKYHIDDQDNAHKVIGQEFDNVIAVIDEHFYYNDTSNLDVQGYYPYYHTTRMLFQIVTRVRNKLHVVIINNEEILERCLSVLGAVNVR